MKNILILYCSFGGGHLMAANSLKEYLEENYDVKVETNDTLEYLNNFANNTSIGTYNFLIRHMPPIYKILYQSANLEIIDSFVDANFMLFRKKFLKFLEEKQPDAIICTHPFPSKICTQLKEKGDIHIPISNIMTDFEIHKQWYSNFKLLTHLFVSSEEMKQDLINKGIPKEKIYITGIPIRPQFLKKYTKQELEDFKKQNNIPKDKKIISFFGGGAFGLSNQSILEHLNLAINIFNDYHFVCITGKNPKLQNFFKEFIEKKELEENCTLLTFTQEPAKLMTISDFIFSKPGGLTTTEALALGVPILMINPLPGQEMANCYFLENHNAGIFLTNDNIEEKLVELKSNPQNIIEMKKNSKQLGKLNATKNICEIILKDLD
ncbi:MAG: MGDG synthase family glycosyltransferase [Clostridium sp.]